MLDISAMPIRIFLDFNAVIVNLAGLPPEEQRTCLDRIERGVKALKAYLQANLDAKRDLSAIPETGLAVLRQQLLLAQAIETWLADVPRPD